MTGAVGKALRRIPASARAVLALALAWAFATRAASPDASAWFAHWLYMRFDWDVEYTRRLCQLLVQRNLAPFLVLASFVVPLALLVRVLARARVRAGLSDPLDRVRRWTSAHSRLTAAALAVPAVAWFSTPVFYVVKGLIDSWVVHPFDALGWLGTVPGACMDLFGALMALTAVGVFASVRGGFRAFLAPTVSVDTVAARPDDRVGFDAVAVTAETRVAVGGMAALAPSMAIAMLALDTQVAPVALTVYAAGALAAIEAFRRASRVDIGVDGVHVTGTSRSRFFAYKDVESVRSRGTDIELFRGKRAILRLQLHGKDAAHRDAIVARIAEAIEAAKARETAAVGEIVGSATDAELARLAEGATGYRTQSVTREQLWSVVEGSEHGAEARTAAARALATTGTVDERGRLRIAAERSAEPRVRVALEEMAEAEEEESAGGARRVAQARG